MKHIHLNFSNMKNILFPAMLLAMAFSLFQCDFQPSANAPKTGTPGPSPDPQSISVIVRDMANDDPMGGVEVQENQDQAVYSKADGSAGAFTIEAGDTLYFARSGYDPAVLVFEDPLSITTVTVYMEPNEFGSSSITGKVFYDNSPCGIASIFNLKNPAEKTNCSSTNGEYSLDITTPRPYRIGYKVNSSSVAKISFDNGTDGVELDIAMDDIGLDTLTQK